MTAPRNPALRRAAELLDRATTLADHLEETRRGTPPYRDLAAAISSLAATATALLDAARFEADHTTTLRVDPFREIDGDDDERAVGYARELVADGFAVPPAVAAAVLRRYNALAGISDPVREHPTAHGRPGVDMVPGTPAEDDDGELYAAAFEAVRRSINTPGDSLNAAAHKAVAAIADVLDTTHHPLQAEQAESVLLYAPGVAEGPRRILAPFLRAGDGDDA